MFEKKLEDRLSAWRNFRETLENTLTPFEDVIEFYRRAPLVSIHTDPWDSSRWPNPWQLLEENEYCDFCTVLGWCYSLQLTDRFKDAKFEIHIVTDKQLGYRYLLLIDDVVLGYGDTVASSDILPKSLPSVHIHVMPPLQ